MKSILFTLTLSFLILSSCTVSYKKNGQELTTGFNPDSKQVQAISNLIPSRP